MRYTVTSMPELLADHTTLRLGGPAAEFVVASTEAELIAAIDDADQRAMPLLVLGGGSNLVVADEGFDGRVVQVATQGVSEDASRITLQAGESWDGFVEWAVAQGRSGIEALSGIPGRVGATPIQNVGAYGQEVAQRITSVRVWDRRTRDVATFAAGECAFGYRMSRFKAEPDRYVVLAVTFDLEANSLSAPLAYAELAAAVDAEIGDRRPLHQVRNAVLGLRAGKGMVLDSSDHDTWSAGSFFTNPIVEAQAVPAGAPSWPQPDGTVKTSAAWLIDHAGFVRGYGNERVSLSTKHTLALTNRGAASTTDLLALASEIRSGVVAAYGITLEPEPVLVNCSL